MRLLLSFRGLSAGTQIFLLILIVMLSGILSLAVAYLAAIAIWGPHVLSPSADSQAISLHFIRLTQIINQIGFFILPPLLWARLSESNPAQFLGFNKPRRVHILFTVLIMAAAGPAIGFLIEWNEGLSLPQWLSGLDNWMRSAEEAASQLTEKFLMVSSPWGLVVNIIMIGLLPAIGEELLFRSALIGIFRKIFKGIHLPVIISAVLFSALHLQFFGFFPRLLLGLAFGYLFVWSGSFWIPAMAHFINNTMVVVASYLYANGFTTINAENLGKSDSSVWIMTSAIVCLTLLFMVYKTRCEATPCQIKPDDASLNAG